MTHPESEKKYILIDVPKYEVNKRTKKIKPTPESLYISFQEYLDRDVFPEIKLKKGAPSYAVDALNDFKAMSKQSK